MRARVGLTILLAALMTITACGEDTVSPTPKKQPTWWLEPDSMNLAILVLNYLTYDFERGRVDHFPPCETCDRDSLPFEQSCEPPNDEGSLTFRYSETGETILYASVTYMGNGWIEYPREFLPPSEFTRVDQLPHPPLSIEFFGHCAKWEPSAEAEAAWFRVRTLDVVKEFATAPYRVGVFWYDASYFDYEMDKWIVFLYRSRLVEPALR